MQNVVILGGGRVVTMRQYVHALKVAKANPNASVRETLRSSWGCHKASEITREFYADMVTDHCNRGLTIRPSKSAESYLLKRIKRGRLHRQCKWCGTEIKPTGIRDWFCSPQCQRDYYN